MKAIKHMMENPFVTGAGIAALAHSTWSLGTLFSGLMPVVTTENYTTFAHWLYWFIPAFLIAFAMDIGQIDTSRKIRHDGLTWQRGLTFFIFAIATYYLQFLYIAHHMPALHVEAGVSELHRIAVTELRNAAIWILPSLLPLATLLYTLSDDKQGKNESLQLIEQDTSRIEHEVVITSLNPKMADWIVDPDSLHDISCPDCDWTGSEYKSERAANLALQAHKRHCPSLVNIERLEMSE